MPFETAVRRFLQPLEAVIGIDGIYWNDYRFYSSALLDCPTYERHATARTRAKIEGYYLSTCVRYIWIEIDNRLLQLAAMLPHLDDQEQRYVSAEEANHYHLQRMHQALALRHHQAAARTYYDQKAKQQIGKSYLRSQRRSGRPKLTRDAIREIRVLRKIL
ncbi:hypothetical protein CEJ42_16005 [Herbaspirillum robiniae]|uniref:Uncharacterized protein n=2 Tax=Herbaspirillum robiniae TaxID=2014887 RepID=A0A246WPZ8_9BURK|nr:hypothetical protein CEJ42_16005 [Herbaspirillum robiniae]